MSKVKEELLSKELLREAKGKEMTQVGEIRAGNHQIIKGDLTLEMTDVWGFCYGVLYAIEAVGKTLEKYPDRNVWILGDLIHNPYVNNQLEKLGATFINPREVDQIGSDDVAVIPAFGTEKEIFEHLDEHAAITVDTTCPEVREVEEQVKEFNDVDHTAIIHGKYEHQESIATSSFAEQYLIVRNPEEAEKVCEFIRTGEGARELREYFQEASSSDFDPESDLQKIGLANQTTMLMNESLEVFEMIQDAVETRDGNRENVEMIDTICSATQDRQDAANRLIQASDFDIFLVVGGFTSSNTKNLARTVRKNGDTDVYHIEDVQCFDQTKITHLPHDTQDDTETEMNWLPEGPIHMGITAGASTPHSELERAIKKLLTFY